MRNLFVLMIGAMVTFSLFSCQNDEVDYFGWEDFYVVTVVPEASGQTFYLKTDSGKTLQPAQTYNVKLTKEQRAIAILTINEKQSDVYDYVVNIHHLDTFLTKPIAENLGNENITIYGNDPVTIHDCWIGDGYLNIWFGTYWGGKTHFINLIQTDAENKPYELEFRHNSYGDSPNEYGRSMVAFDLSSLPDTNGKSVDLKINVRLYDSGEKTLTLKYNSETGVSGSPDNLESVSRENTTLQILH